MCGIAALAPVCTEAVHLAVDHPLGDGGMASDKERKGLEAYMAATAAARDLTAAIKAAQVFGLVLAIGIGDSLVPNDGSSEIQVYLTGDGFDPEDGPAEDV